ncbi:unnamed protein product, partial [Owenia fusiformis]
MITKFPVTLVVIIWASISLIESHQRCPSSCHVRHHVLECRGRLLPDDLNNVIVECVTPTVTEIYLSHNVKRCDCKWWLFLQQLKKRDNVNVFSYKHNPQCSGNLRKICTRMYQSHYNSHTVERPPHNHRKETRQDLAENNYRVHRKESIRQNQNEVKTKSEKETNRGPNGDKVDIENKSSGQTMEDTGPRRMKEALDSNLKNKHQDTKSDPQEQLSNSNGLDSTDRLLLRVLLMKMKTRNAPRRHLDSTRKDKVLPKTAIPDEDALTQTSVNAPDTNIVKRIKTVKKKHYTRDNYPDERIQTSTIKPDINYPPDRRTKEAKKNHLKNIEIKRRKIRRTRAVETVHDEKSNKSDANHVLANDISSTPIPNQLRVNQSKPIVKKVVKLGAKHETDKQVKLNATVIPAKSSTRAPTHTPITIGQVPPTTVVTSHSTKVPLESSNDISVTKQTLRDSLVKIDRMPIPLPQQNIIVLTPEINNLKMNNLERPPLGDNASQNYNEKLAQREMEEMNSFASVEQINKEQNTPLMSSDKNKSASISTIAETTLSSNSQAGDKNDKTTTVASIMKAPKHEIINKMSTTISPQSKYTYKGQLPRVYMPFIPNIYGPLNEANAKSDKHVLTANDLMPPRVYKGQMLIGRKLYPLDKTNKESMDALKQFVTDTNKKISVLSRANTKHFYMKIFLYKMMRFTKTYLGKDVQHLVEGPVKRTIISKRSVNKPNENDTRRSFRKLRKMHFKQMPYTTSKKKHAKLPSKKKARRKWKRYYNTRNTKDQRKMAKIKMASAKHRGMKKLRRHRKQRMLKQIGKRHYLTRNTKDQRKMAKIKKNRARLPRQKELRRQRKHRTLQKKRKSSRRRKLRKRLSKDKTHYTTRNTKDKIKKGEINKNHTKALRKRNLRKRIKHEILQKKGKRHYMTKNTKYERKTAEIKKNRAKRMRKKKQKRQRKHRKPKKEKRNDITRNTKVKRKETQIKKPRAKSVRMKKLRRKRKQRKLKKQVKRHYIRR